MICALTGTQRQASGTPVCGLVAGIAPRVTVGDGYIGKYLLESLVKGRNRK